MLTRGAQLGSVCTSRTPPNSPRERVENALRHQLETEKLTPVVREEVAMKEILACLGILLRHVATASEAHFPSNHRCWAATFLKLSKATGDKDYVGT